MKLNTTLLSAVIIGAFSVGSACAGSLVGTPATTSADVTFGANTQVTNALTPVAGVSSGYVSSGTILAKGTISAADSQSHRYAVNITNGVYYRNKGSAIIRKISGTNNSAHKLLVHIDATEPFSVEKINTSSMTVTNNMVPGTFEYVITAHSDSEDGGSGVVQPDTYTVWTEAFIYNA